MNQDPRALVWLKTATGMEETVETKDLDTQEFADDMTRMDCKKFNTLLYNILITKLKGKAFNIVSSVHDGCGLRLVETLDEALRTQNPSDEESQDDLQHEGRQEG